MWGGPALPTSCMRLSLPAPHTMPLGNKPVTEPREELLPCRKNTMASRELGQLLQSASLQPKLMVMWGRWGSVEGADSCQHSILLIVPACCFSQCSWKLSYVGHRVEADALCQLLISSYATGRAMSEKPPASNECVERGRQSLPFSLQLSPLFLNP